MSHQQIHQPINQTQNLAIINIQFKRAIKEKVNLKSQIYRKFFKKYFIISIYL